MSDQIEWSVRRESGRTRIKLRFPVATQPQPRMAPAAKARSPVFLQSLTVERDGATIFSGHFGPYMARFPEIDFDLDSAGAQAAEPGRLDITWTDSLGRRFRQVLSLSS